MKRETGTAGARHALLTEWLADQGRLDVVEVAGRLGVAQETIRRDLRTLEGAGKLQRVHGGAVPADAEPLVPLPTPSPRASAEDQALAHLVWKDLPRSGTILLGTGRLTLALVQAMIGSPPERAGLTVVTNSLDAAVDLSRIPRLSVYNIGGTVSHATRAQEGDWALEELGRLHVDVAVVCPAGITVEHGLSQITPAAAAIAQAEVASASSTMALCPAEILGRDAFVGFARLDQVDRLVVAGRPVDGALKPLADRGMSITVVSPADSAPSRNGVRLAAAAALAD